MFFVIPNPPLPLPKREPLVITRCQAQLWEGVRCTLASGHKGSHHRPANHDGSCELSWRSSTRRFNSFAEVVK